MNMMTTGFHLESLLHSPKICRASFTSPQMLNPLFIKQWVSVRYASIAALRWGGVSRKVVNSIGCS